MIIIIITIKRKKEREGWGEEGVKEGRKEGRNEERKRKPLHICPGTDAEKT